MDDCNSKQPISRKDYGSSITLIITGDDLDPERVTEILQLSPSQSWKRGEKKVFRSGRKFVYPWGGWKLFQKENTNEEGLEKQFEWWVDALASKSIQIRQLEEMQCFAVLDCYIAVPDAATAQLSPELLSKIARIGVGIELNFFADRSENE